MKRQIVSGIVLIVLVSLMSGCDSLRTIRGTGDMTAETREVSNFSAVDLATFGNVVIEYGEREGLRIEAEENLLPYLESEVEGGKLILGHRDGVNILPTQGIFYYLTVRELDEVRVSGLGNIDAPRLEGTQVEMRISGAGDINVAEVNAKKLDVILSGLGNLTIDAGEVSNSDIELKGAGSYNASNLASEVVTVDVSGMGSAAVWARDALDATISGGGSIQYSGDPSVTQKITGIGEVRSSAGS